MMHAFPVDALFFCLLPLPFFPFPPDALGMVRNKSNQGVTHPTALLERTRKKGERNRVFSYSRSFSSMMTTTPRRAAGAFAALALLGGCDGFGPPSSRSRVSRTTANPLRSTVAPIEEPASTDNTPRDEEQTGKSLTQRIMESTSSAGQAGGAGGSSTWDAFLRTEANWSRLKEFSGFDYDSMTSLPSSARHSSIPKPPQFVTDDGSQGNPRAWAKLRAHAEDSTPLDYDVAVCGGTLGIFIALALQIKGLNVAVIEAGKLQGREQEWNISMKELEELVDLGVLTKEIIDEAVTTEFPGCRSGFKNSEVTPLEGGYFENGVGYECFTPGVLNLGVSPSVLIKSVAERFRERGGTVLEGTPLKGICISDSIGAAIDMGDGDEPITAKLVLDCMGNASPISRQQRYGRKPDGVCAVVGSCAGGYDKESNVLGDIIYTNNEIQDKGPNGKLQYFWEAFPVGIGRNGNEPGSSDVKTTYMFTYMDAEKDRPSLTALMDDYWELLPIYQPSIQDVERDLDVKRVLFAYFPTYTDSPLKPMWSRLLAVGDASGIQSPLSFGGFGALTRHLDRISGAISEAVENDLLHKSELGEINAYTPNLS